MMNLEGSLLSAELVAHLEGLPGQRDADFDLPKGERLADAIVRAWSEARALYQVFKSRMERVPESESGAGDTRRFWLEPLMVLLGYDPVYQHQGETIENHHFPISHRDSQMGTPLHLSGFRQDPDKRRPGVDRLSPHALLQEYLNRKEESLYGLLSNGLSLRLLRDNARLKQQQYAEWNLQRMFEEDRFPEFAQMYRLLHASRLRSEKHDPAGCLLETYHQKGIEEGNRIRDGLRDAVMDALELLGNGFLQHRDNEALRSALRGSSLAPEEYNRQLRRLIYRLLFLLVAEERELIFGDDTATGPEQRRIRQIYRQHYSMARLREMAALRRRCDGQAQNIWRELLVTFGIFESESLGKPFGIIPLDGELFHPEALGEMQGSALHNSVLLEALHRLNTYEDRVSQTRRRINYRSLDVEELGSVYESLLDLHPFIQTEEGGKMTFSYIRATERKTTGSYYTRHDLVAELLQSALEPVMAERLRAAGKDANKQAEALLQLKVCDPSCGSGHFLLAAARRIALELAQVRAGGEQPTAGSVRAALREVIEHCVYGVDLNPDAVELCQVALWLESHCPGRPLGFLQHKIRCGNSLVGVHDLTLLEKGLPDEAFKELAGDDKEEARALRKQNKAWREKRQFTLFGETPTASADATDELGEAFRLFDALDDSTVHGRQLKARTWEQLRSDQSWLRPLTGCNLFAAAFFQPIRAGQRHIGAELLSRQQKTILGASADAQLEGRAYGLAERHRFFHWPLEFPDVFAQGGFDVMLGNPPWERIKLQQQEYFATRDAAIANAANKAERERLIKQMAANRPDLYAQFQDALHEAEATAKFLRSSSRYALTAVGDINTYSVFSELFSQLVRPEGRAGFIVPTGIATDDSNKVFFGAMVEQNRLVSLFDFENREKIFPAVDSRYKFSLLTLSGASRGTEAARFGFFLTRTAHLQDEQRIFTLNSDDFLRLNPNTRTCPVFRTRVDAELTAKIYNAVPIFINQLNEENPWDVWIRQGLYHMTNDNRKGIIVSASNNTINKPVRLFEGKMIWQYDHKFATYINGDYYELEEKDVFSQIQSEYIVEENENISRLNHNNWNKKWLFCYRNITNSTNERTLIAAITPLMAPVYSFRVLFFKHPDPIRALLLISCFNSIPFDWITRQKVGGTNLSDHYIKQLTVISPTELSKHQLNVAPKVLELTYTSWDIKAFADDIWRESDEALRSALVRQWEENREMTGGHEWVLPEWADAYPEICWEREGGGCPLPPFRWDEERRARLRARLDAHYARLYGLSYDELRYILDPQDVYGPDFPGETFRVLKDKEMRMYGEYRTRRLVLEAWGEGALRS
jgi:hypothetical protein